MTQKSYLLAVHKRLNRVRFISGYVSHHYMLCRFHFVCSLCTHYDINRTVLNTLYYFATENVENLVLYPFRLLCILKIPCST